MTASWCRRFAGPGLSPRLHQADRPAVARQGVADGDRPPAHGGLPVAAARGHADLREDGVDHGVDEVVLVGHVAVQRHGRDLELLGERAHGEGLEPARVCLLDRRAQHSLPAQAASRSSSRCRVCGHSRDSSGLRLNGPDCRGRMALESWGLTGADRTRTVYNVYEMAYTVNRTREAEATHAGDRPGQVRLGGGPRAHGTSRSPRSGTTRSWSASMRRRSTSVTGSS